MPANFTISCGEYRRTIPLLDGRVRLKGVNLEFIADPFPEQGMLPDYQHIRNQRMVVDRAFDISELGIAPYLSARAADAPVVAIPVFHYRRFRHGYIFCRDDLNIQHPQDLVGRRVGVRRLNLSAGLWARILLQEEYDVPLDQITWVVAFDVPLRPQVRERLKIKLVPPGETLESLLIRGEIDAAIEASNLSLATAGGHRIRRLLGEDTTQLEVDYYVRTGIFPIMHTVVLWKSLVSEHPELPQQLHQAFMEAKSIGVQEPDRPLRYVLAEEERQWWDSLTQAQRRLLVNRGEEGPRDPWIYSVREDRKTFETFLDHAYEQGLTPIRYQVEDLFAESTLDL
jgi:4,5-dihydroxyphthalate decarboxylase